MLLTFEVHAEAEVIAHDLRQRLTGVNQHIMHAVLFAAVLDAGLKASNSLIGLPNLRRASQNLGHIFQPVKFHQTIEGNSSSYGSSVWNTITSWPMKRRCWNTLHRFFFIKEITDQDEDLLARRLHRHVMQGGGNIRFLSAIKR